MSGALNDDRKGIWSHPSTNAKVIASNAGMKNRHHGPRHHGRRFSNEFCPRVDGVKTSHLAIQVLHSTTEHGCLVIDAANTACKGVDAVFTKPPNRYIVD